MNPDRPTSELDAIIRNVRWLMAAFTSVRNARARGLSFQQAIEQLGHPADGPQAPPGSTGSSSPATGAAPTGLARQTAERMTRQADARTARQSQAAGSPLPAPVRAAMDRGQKIEAIRLLRAHTGLGLKEAKDAVEAHGGAANVAAKTPTPASTLAPGEVPPSGTSAWIWILVALGAAGLLLHRYVPAWSG